MVVGGPGLDLERSIMVASASCSGTFVGLGDPISRFVQRARVVARGDDAGGDSGCTGRLGKAATSARTVNRCGTDDDGDNVSGGWYAISSPGVRFTRFLGVDDVSAPSSVLAISGRCSPPGAKGSPTLSFYFGADPRACYRHAFRLHHAS